MRLARLLQKSRKALRLYSSMERSGQGRAAEFRDLQVQAWKEVNSELACKLESAMQNINARQLVREVFELRDHFHSAWRTAEAELHLAHKDLLAAAEGGDFIRAAHASLKLVGLKARLQACQAGHHELQSVIDQSKVAQPTIELSREQIVTPAPEDPPHRAKIIPLLQKGAR
ncbi:MAG: hypothetical protein GX589_06025 [Deltaproteobacteria bacterium]|nr:hypothetical protein [Deltaproteobacteria bacterium]